MNWIQMNILAEMGFYISSENYAQKGVMTSVWFDTSFKTYKVIHNGKRFVFDTFEGVTRFFNGEK